MYTVDSLDTVTAISDIPWPDGGSPNPLVLSNNLTTVLAYFMPNRPVNWDGTWVRMVGLDTDGEPVAIVRFQRCSATMFGPPNDEAFSGHPLASRGLESCRMGLVQNSSWIRGLERMNSVHPNHSPALFARYKHYIIPFKESTFECVAESYDCEVHTGSVASMLPRMLEKLKFKQP